MADEIVSVPLVRRRGGLVAYAIVDVADAPAILSHSWRAVRSPIGTLYAFRYVVLDGRQRKLWLHREILGLPVIPKGLHGDHINRDSLDNRRANLRVVTHAQNHQNTASRRGSTSFFRGVSWEVRTGKWRGDVKLDGRSIWCKRFPTESEAAAAVAAKRRELMPFTVEEVAS